MADRAVDPDPYADEPKAGEEELLLTQLARPRTRADCVDGPRPCPFVGCRYHLMLQVVRAGRLQFNFRDLTAVPDTCVLDVADRGGEILENIGTLFGLTRERIRQLEVLIIRRLRHRAAQYSLDEFHEGHAP